MWIHVKLRPGQLGWALICEWGTLWGVRTSPIQDSGPVAGEWGIGSSNSACLSLRASDEHTGDWLDLGRVGDQPGAMWFVNPLALVGTEPDSGVDKCYRDLSPVEVSAYQLAARITACLLTSGSWPAQRQIEGLPTTHPEPRHCSVIQVPAAFIGGAILSTT